MESISVFWKKYQHTWGESIGHEYLPIWCVFYRETNVSRGHWSAYIAIEPTKRGRHPCEGGVNNKRVGSDSGFKTLAEACEAAEKAAQ